MEQGAAEEILTRVGTGTASRQEQELAENWYMQYGSENAVPFSEEKLEQIRQQMWRQMPVMPASPRRRKLVHYRIGMAAAVASIVFGIWFFYNKGQDSSGARQREEWVKHDIAPGKNTATLTLASGRRVTLSDQRNGVQVGATIKYDDGSLVSETLQEELNQSPVQMLEASTPRGGTYQFTLPDGTRVWLNAASSIRFPSRFSGRGGQPNKRIVVLSGEAYFEVFKNKTQPFVVSTKNQDVEVLGTHFNVNEYEDETEVRTTLLEGSVSVTGKNHPGGKGSERRVLKPGEQARLSANQNGTSAPGGLAIQVVQVDTEVATAWKDGLFMFEGERLESIMRKISRWYAVDVHFAEESLKNLKFSGSVSRFEHVSELLDQLAHTHPIDFVIENRIITVKNK